jgi:hypothetical protein
MLGMALLLITTTIASAKSTNPGVLPPNSRVQGLTYGGWIARWWKYALELPSAQNPITGGTGANCAYQRVGNVALVVASSTLDVPIQCAVPAGTMLYLEVLGAECSTLEPAPFYGGDEAELRACAQGIVPQDLMASIDGVAIQNLSKYIFTSPMYKFTVPDDNILGAPAGAIGESVGYGAYLLIAPLSPGTHTIHAHGTYPGFDFIADRTFNLTITQH